MNHKHLARVLGEIFKEHRLMKANDTLEEAGEKAGLDGNNLGRIERGEQVPDLTTLFKMIKAYHIDFLEHIEDINQAIQQEEKERKMK